MTYKIRKQPKVKKAFPLPEALPGRGDKPWTIEEATTGRAKCKFTEEAGGTLSVPLNNERCDSCGSNHAAAARLHELAHAALSPDLNKVRSTFRSSGETYQVSPQGIAIAEEIRADWQAAKVARRRGIEFNTDCETEDTEYMVELMENHDFKQLGIELLSRSAGYQLSRKARLQLREKIEAAREKADHKTVGRLHLVDQTAAKVQANAQQIKRFAQKNYRNNPKSWSRQLHVGYAIDQYLEAVEDQMDEFEQDLEEMKQAQKEANKEKPPEKNDLDKIKENLENRSGGKKSEGQRFVQNLMAETSFKKQLEHTEKLKALEKHQDQDRNDVVKWGRMEIQTPRLTKKLPTHKKGWKARASDEGTIPQYMHRWPVDQAVFRSRRREQSGSVLIDVSGSMSLSQEELDAIIAAAPAGIIAIYSGYNSNGQPSGSAGHLRIVGEKGKFADFTALSEQYDGAYLGTKYEYRAGMGGGNEIDKPALQWLAKQPLPRIWVSDGQVVSPTHSFSELSWKDCEQVILKNRINRVNSPEEAAQALEGKLALWR